MRQADNLTDINNILPLVKRTLRQQNEKGLKKYGKGLKDNNLPVLALLKHSFEEKIDDIQYTGVAIQTFDEISHLIAMYDAGEIDAEFLIEELKTILGAEEDKANG